MGEPAELLLTRRSVGKVTADPVAGELVRAILTAATTAPNHHLTQPWRFVVLEGAARRTVGTAHSAAYARTHPTAPVETLEREAARLERAPIVIACVVEPSSSDPVVAREDRDAVAAAVQNILLAAHAYGLGAMWRSGAMVDEPEVRAALGITDGSDIVAFVYIGHVAVAPPRKARRPLDEVMQWRTE